MVNKFQLFTNGPVYPKLETTDKEVFIHKPYPVTHHTQGDTYRRSGLDVKKEWNERRKRGNPCGIEEFDFD